MAEPVYDFGMIGLGTMGRNLLLNIADHGFAAIGYDKDPSKANLLESSASAGTNVKGVASLAEMVSAVKNTTQADDACSGGTYRRRCHK